MSTTTIRKYRKKPAVIEALQYFGDNSSDLMQWANEQTNVLERTGISNNILVVQTREGAMEVSVGDYLIKGVKGEFYPYKPDIFWASYDLEHIA